MSNHQTIGVLASHSSFACSIDKDNTYDEPQAKRVKYTKATLETINDDCLRYICKYLDSYETAQLGLTCTRLYDFAIDCTSLKKYKRVQIIMDEFKNYPSEITMESLESEFSHFGWVVKELTWSGCSFEKEAKAESITILEKMLKLFPNLDFVYICCIKFMIEDFQVL